ncbi:hypothetical protein [Nocardia beijingensis]|nr:hypothetical protein [Nocardia beijingensis]
MTAPVLVAMIPVVAAGFGLDRLVAARGPGITLRQPRRGSRWSAR